MENTKNNVVEINKKRNNVIDRLKKNSSGNIKKLLSNLRIMLEAESECERIGFNEFTCELTIDREPIGDFHINEFRLRLDTKYEVTFNERDIKGVLDVLGREKSYHPIKEFIEKNKWDGLKRAEKLFIDYLGAPDDEYIRQTTKKWLTGSVARIYEPGIKFEIIPILRGAQGIGKSTIVSKLGGDYYTDSLQSLGKTKDDYQTLIGNWIIELGELSSMNSTEVEKIKNFTSATEDKIRLPHDKMPQTFKRTCSFVGTTNYTEYLTDLSGNRRFFPIPLKKDRATRDIFELDQGTIQQILAEAYYYYLEGEKLFVSDNRIEKMAEKYRGEATEQNLIVSDIKTYLNMPVDKNWNNTDLRKKRTIFLNYQNSGETIGSEKIDRTSAKEIISVVFNIKNNDHSQKSMMKQIKLYMDNLDDWTSKVVKINKQSIRGYSRL